LGRCLSTALEKLVEDVELLYGEPAHAPPAFQLLSDLPFVGAVSANWDQVLEKEMFSARNPLIALARDAQLLAESLREARFTILKLLGGSE
jgi:hypothetical protein